MSITNTVYEHLLREYDAKQTKARRDLRLRMQKIESQIPELPVINGRIAQLSVDQAVRRIRRESTDPAAYEEEKNALIRRRDELLKDAGLSPADLAPVYECSLCADTGFIGDQKCSCFKNRLIDILYDQSNVKEILQRENFRTHTLRYYSDVPISPDSPETPRSIAQKAVLTAREFVEHFDETADNLFICGDTGTGKTFLSNCIAREILDKGQSVIYLSAVRLFRILAEDTFGKSRDNESAELINCDLLIIDDLGTEYTNAFVQSAFFNCINERLLRRKHTILSTNLSMEQIRENYSERVFSRIAEKYTLIRLFGKDIRILKKLEE